MPGELIVPTKRRHMSKARAAAIFLREQGRCYLCTVQLRLGIDKYQIEHPKALNLGGSDDDAELRVVCIPCHKSKTQLDAGAKAERDRHVTAAWVPPEGERRSKWPSQRLGSGNNQHTATRSIRRETP